MTVDAVLIESNRIKGGDEVEKALWVKATFGPVLNSPRVYSRSVVGGVHLLTREPIATRYFPSDGDRAGQERYTWTDQGQGVQYGSLVEGANGPS